MKLVSMKRPPRKAKESKTYIPCEPMSDAYPYGLRISLEAEQLEKLGIKIGDFEVGGEFGLTAQCCVISVSMQAGKDYAGKANSSKRVELQIEKMALQEELEDRTMGDAINDGIREAKS